MSTLGFGDITFTSDVGRLFTVLVLVSGIILLLIVLPFAFIRRFLEEPRRLDPLGTVEFVVAEHDTTGVWRISANRGILRTRIMGSSKGSLQAHAPPVAGSDAFSRSTRKPG